MERKRIWLALATTLVVGVIAASPAYAAPGKNDKAEAKAGKKAEATEHKADAAEHKAEAKADKRSGRKAGKSGDPIDLATDGTHSSVSGKGKKHSKGMSLKHNGLKGNGDPHPTKARPKKQSASGAKPGSHPATPAYSPSSAVVVGSQPTYSIPTASSPNRSTAESRVKSATAVKEPAASGIAGLPGEIVDLVVDAPPSVSFPLILAVGGLFFLLVQGRLDRSDPKIAQASKKRSFVQFE